MSLLFADQTETGVLLVSDTVTATMEKEAYSFGSKVRPFPHLNMAVSVLGAGWIGMSWKDVIDRSPGFSDIESVNAHAPEVLRDLWAALKSRPEPTPTTATVYHYGFPTGLDKLVRYVYRSTKDFEPELFVGSEFTVKPMLPDFQFKRPQSREEIIDLAVHVRDLNRANMAGDGWGVRIGGDLFVTLVEKWSIHTVHWHRFDDYDETDTAIQHRIARES